MAWQIAIATTAVLAFWFANPLIANAVLAPEPITAPLPPPVEEPQPVTVIASVSAFTSSVDETDDTPEVTASGSRVHSGTSACPMQYAFGTVIEVHGVQYTCEDRMALRFRYGDYFDLWKPSKYDALQWGRRTVEVRIIQ